MSEIAATMGQASSSAPLRILIEGDSPAHDYKPDKCPQSGLGTMLRCPIDFDVTVENRAFGRSSQAWIQAARSEAKPCYLHPEGRAGAPDLAHRVADDKHGTRRVPALTRPTPAGGTQCV